MDSNSLVKTETAVTPPPKKRIAKWDNAKFLLILFVVMGHFSDSHAKSSEFWFFIQTARLLLTMPAFIFITGLFSKKMMNSETFPFEKILPFFNLFLVTRIPRYLAVPILGYPLYPLNFFEIRSVDWYCFAVFVFLTITWLARKIDVKYMLFFSLVLACFIGYDKNIGDYLCLSRIFRFYPFFIAGFAIPSDKLLKIIERKSVKIASVLFLAAVIAALNIPSWHKAIPLLSMTVSYYNEGVARVLAPIPPEIWWLVRVAHYALLSAVVFAFFSIVPAQKTFFSTLGAYTLPVYVLHVPCLFLLARLNVVKYFIEFFPNYWGVVSIIVPTILTLLLSSKHLEELLTLVSMPVIHKGAADNRLF